LSVAAAAFGEAAPLIATPQSPIPAGGQAEWFAGAGGARLRAALFAAKDPIGTVVLSTGRTEFIEKYLEVITELVGRGFTVLAHDWRGQGLSQRLTADRLKGCADGFDDFVADYAALLTAFESRAPKPWIALSHSMGGCLTLLALARGEARFSACLLSAPMLGLKAARSPLARPVSALLRHAGLSHRYMRRKPVGPRLDDFAANDLTHDRARFERTLALIRACPDLALGDVTWGWVDSALSAMAWLARTPRLAGLTLPVTAVAAERESLVDNAAIEQAMGKIPGGRFVVVPEARHELLMETDDIRAAFLREFDALAARVGAVRR
jgi:lysophospholipase